MKVMGPIAKIVFIDSLYKWLNNDQPSIANLPQLIEYLCDELNDPDKANSYKQIVSSYLDIEATSNVENVDEKDQFSPSAR